MVGYYKCNYKRPIRKERRDNYILKEKTRKEGKEGKE
jgi:hypothetical protein